MVILKVLGRHDGDGQHFCVARLRKQVSPMSQSRHQIINDNKCGYNPRGVHGALLWTVVW
jgi:hypothetical protein